MATGGSMRGVATIATATGLLLGLLLGSAGCSDDSSPTVGSSATTDAPTADEPSTTSADATVATTSTTEAATSAVPPPGSVYVALGSSIASGFGISVQSTDCGRSNRNYPNLIATRFQLALTDVTCGGAIVPNVVDTAQGANPPQLQAVTADARLVSVTVGGNDIVYNGTALACADPATECTAPADLEARVAGVGPALVAMIDAIRAAAPEATIVLVTYPREVPDTNCAELSLGDTERAVLQDMGARLQEVFVDVAADTGVVLVDPYSEPGDHTGCAPPEERWVAGAVADDGFAFHPTALGHEEMAALIADALGS